MEVYYYCQQCRDIVLQKTDPKRNFYICYLGHRNTGVYATTPKSVNTKRKKYVLSLPNVKEKRRLINKKRLHRRTVYYSGKRVGR